MIAWFLRSIGVGREIAANLSKAELYWARPVVLWVGLVLLVPVITFVVLRHKRNLPHVSPGMRNLLSFCRAGVLVLLVIVLAGPTLRLDEEVTQKPILAVVIDESASMNLPAGPFTEDESKRLSPLISEPGRLGPGSSGAPEPGPGRPGSLTVTPEMRKKLNTMTRAQLVEAVLAHEKDTLVKPLEARFDVRVYRASREVRSGTLEEPEKEPLPAVDGQETDLGDAMGKAIDDAASRPLAGMVVISDGRWTTGPDPLQVVQRMVTLAPPLGGRVGGGPSNDKPSTAGAPLPPASPRGEGEEKSGQVLTSTPGSAPIWSVPVGSSEPMVDAGLVDVLAPPQVAKGDSVTVVATVDSHGLDNRTVQVKLLQADGKAIDTKPLTLSGAERQQVQLTFTADQPGADLLTVAVDEQPEEQDKENNRQRVLIKVDTDKERLLYLEGAPRWDFRFLDHSLRRDNGLDVTLVMEAQLRAFNVLPGDLPRAAKLPQDAAGFAEYNTVVLGDISPDLLPPRLQEQLVKAVEEDGLGLIVQAGPAHMPRDFAGMPLEHLLPVKLPRTAMAADDSGGVIHLAGLDAPDFQPFHMKVTATGAIHPAFELYENATQNRGIWSRMPEFYWAADVEDAGPTATVLAKLDSTGEPRPLIAERYAGRGRVFFVGLDSTYRWRRNIGSHLFYRFWGQAIRYVARNKDRGGDKSWMEATPGRVEPGQGVAVEVYAVDSEGSPLDRSELRVQVTGADMADEVKLGRVTQGVSSGGGGSGGHFRGVWQPKNLGAYRLSYTDAKGEVATAAVNVEGSGREFRRPSVDRDLLGSLADATGGGVLELDQIGTLPGVLKGQPVTIHEPHESELWDNWLTLVLLVGLYCTDVGVRRLLGLT